MHAVIARFSSDPAGLSLLVREHRYILGKINLTRMQLEPERCVKPTLKECLEACGEVYRECPGYTSDLDVNESIENDANRPDDRARTEEDAIRGDKLAPVLLIDLSDECDDSDVEIVKSRHFAVENGTVYRSRSVSPEKNDPIAKVATCDDPSNSCILDQQQQQQQQQRGQQREPQQPQPPKEEMESSNIVSEMIRKKREDAKERRRKIRALASLSVIEEAGGSSSSASSIERIASNRAAALKRKKQRAVENSTKVPSSSSSSHIGVIGNGNCRKKSEGLHRTNSNNVTIDLTNTATAAKTTTTTTTSAFEKPDAMAKMYLWKRDDLRVSITKRPHNLRSKSRGDIDVSARILGIPSTYENVETPVRARHIVVPQCEGGFFKNPTSKRCRGESERERDATFASPNKRSRRNPEPFELPVDFPMAYFARVWHSTTAATTEEPQSDDRTSLSRIFGACRSLNRDWKAATERAVRESFPEPSALFDDVLGARIFGSDPSEREDEDATRREEIELGYAKLARVISAGFYVPVWTTECLDLSKTLKSLEDWLDGSQPSFPSQRRRKFVFAMLLRWCIGKCGLEERLSCRNDHGGRRRSNKSSASVNAGFFGNRNKSSSEASDLRKIPFAPASSFASVSVSVSASASVEDERCAELSEIVSRPEFAEMYGRSGYEDARCNEEGTFMWNKIDPLELVARDVLEVLDSGYLARPSDASSPGAASSRGAFAGSEAQSEGHCDVARASSDAMMRATRFLKALNGTGSGISPDYRFGFDAVIRWCLEHEGRLCAF